MLKQTFAIVLTLAFLVNTGTANAAVGMKEIFDNYTYTAQVEGDQDMAINNLKADLKVAQEQGLTNEEMLHFALSQVKDQNVANEIRSTLTLFKSGAIPSEVAHDMVRDIFSKSNSQGASWNGSASTGLLIVGLIAIIAVGIYYINEDCQDRNIFEEESDLCD